MKNCIIIHMKPEVKIIKNFLKSLDIHKDVKVNACSYKTSVNLYKKTLYFDKSLIIDPFYRDVVGKGTFQILLSEGFDFSEIEYATYAVLHEIGHIITIAQYKDACKEDVEYENEHIRLLLEDRERKKQGMDYLESEWILNKEYRKLKLEYDADEKAYEIYRSFPDEINAFNVAMKQFAKEESLRNQAEL